MSKFGIAVVVFLLAGAAILWSVQHQAEVRLRAEREALQQQLAQMGALAADNDRLSNLVAQTHSFFSSQQMKELLKLRGEIGMLRRETNELRQLKQQNDQLRTALNAANDSQHLRGANSSAGQPAVAVYPKESWAFAGFATPEAAFQSLNWAAANGDTNTFLSGMTPDAYEKMFGNQTNGNISDDLKNRINQNTSMRILSEEVISDNEVLLNAIGDAEGFNTPAKLVFRNIDGQWKFSAEH